jgi:hypothetical protein
MSRLEQLALAAAVSAGLLVGLMDTRAQEVQPAVLLLLLAGTALGALAPRATLAIGVALGLGVPLVHAYMRLEHATLPYATNGYAGTFLALVPATIGALVGGWMRRALSHP